MTDQPNTSDQDPYRTSRFAEIYEGVAPWESGRPQPAIVALMEKGAIVGRVLDAGCGTGENAIYLASKGLEVLGIDAIDKPIAMAEQKARDRNSTARFRKYDALELTSLGESFDTIIDSGLFHVFSDGQRLRYTAGLRAVLRRGGICHLLCFSEHEIREEGPRRVTQSEIQGSFASGWKIISIDPAIYDAPHFPGGAKCWIATLQCTALLK